VVLIDGGITNTKGEALSRLLRLRNGLCVQTQRGAPGLTLDSQNTVFFLGFNEERVLSVCTGSADKI
jgi:hypothetical protein